MDLEGERCRVNLNFAPRAWIESEGVQLATLPHSLLALSKLWAVLRASASVSLSSAVRSSTRSLIVAYCDKNVADELISNGGLVVTLARE